MLIFYSRESLSANGMVLGRVVLRETPAMKGANARIVMIQVYITQQKNLLPVNTQVLLGMTHNGIKPF